MNKNSKCDHICFSKNIKLDIYINEYISSCEENNYTHEANNICYSGCPENTYVTINNDKIC